MLWCVCNLFLFFKSKVCFQSELFQGSGLTKDWLFIFPKVLCNAAMYKWKSDQDKETRVLTIFTGVSGSQWKPGDYCSMSLPHWLHYQQLITQAIILFLSPVKGHIDFVWRKTHYSQSDVGCYQWQRAFTFSLFQIWLESTFYCELELYMAR